MPPRAVPSTQDLEERIADWLAAHHGGLGQARREDVEGLYTDGCAALLDIEVRRVRVRRRQRAAELAAAYDREAEIEAGRLTAAHRALVTEFQTLRPLVVDLRRALDGVPRDDQPDAGPRRARFKRRG